jgi:hypothetical protein
MLNVDHAANYIPPSDDEELNMGERAPEKPDNGSDSWDSGEQEEGDGLLPLGYVS